MSVTPTRQVDVGVAAATDIAKPWTVIVWNDEVNLMSYVVYVFRKHFGYDEGRARKLMMQVHFAGKAAVSHGPREKVEADVAAMHTYGLWATMEQN